MISKLYNWINLLIIYYVFFIIKWIKYNINKEGLLKINNLHIYTQLINNNILREIILYLIKII